MLTAIPIAKRFCRAPGKRLVRHDGIYRPMGLLRQPNPGAEANCLPPVGPESQVEERAGRNTLWLIVPMSSGRLSLDRVGRHQSPSPFHRQDQSNTHSEPWGSKGDISTLHRWGHFYFALTAPSQALTPPGERG
jgi:hypothetical protein